MQETPYFGRRISPWLLGLLLFLVYLVTLAPDITWANSGSDGGDLIAAAATGGVAHPTGYPTYLILARLFQFLPIGSLAYRTNLMSALASALAAALLCDLTRRSMRLDGLQSDVLGWITGLAYGLAPLVWSQSVITEVYAIQGLGIVLVLWILARPPGKHSDLVLGLLSGVLLGVHLTMVLLIPAFMVSQVLRSQPTPFWRSAWLSFARQMGGFGIGLLIFITLPLRALNQPAVNWGDVVTPSRFWWLVSGQIYQSNLSINIAGSLGKSLQTAGEVLLGQAGLLGLVLGIAGLIFCSRSVREVLVTVWMFVAPMLFFIFYRTGDSFVYLIPASISFAIWIGWGGLVAITHLSKWTGHAVGVMLVIYLLSLAAWHWPQVNAAQDQQAKDFAKQAIVSLPMHAIVLVRGDAAIFDLWYMQYALRQRLDIAILAEDLLPFDWYRDNLHATYPGLNLPNRPDSVWAAALSSENPGRPLCYALSDSTNPITCH